MLVDQFLGPTVPNPSESFLGNLSHSIHVLPTFTHRRLRLPQRHTAPPATEAQPNSTHSSFRVLNLRGWFGLQIIGYCTPRLGFLNLGIGLGPLHASSAPLKAHQKHLNPHLGF